MSLREGQAFDILDELRQQIKVNAMLQIDKEENVWGTRASTRSFKAINEAIVSSGIGCPSIVP